MQFSTKSKAQVQDRESDHLNTTAQYYGPQEAIASTSFLPEWIRLPRSGCREPITGLSRSMLNLLILACEENGFRPPVKSFSLRRKGTLRGVRLISTQSLLDYLRDLEAEQNPEPLFDPSAVGNEEKPSNPHGFIQQTKTKSHPRVA